MKGFTKRKIGLLLLILVCTSWVAQGQVTFPKPVIDTVEVVGVRDGDTIDALINGEKSGIRLSGIDAPEKTQPYYQKSKELLSKFVFGKTIVVTLYGTDRYGRYLGDIKLINTNTWINLVLVQNGLAWHYKAYSKDTTLALAETKARAYKDGLWADLGTATPPVEPWNFRKSKRTP